MRLAVDVMIGEHLLPQLFDRAPRVSEHSIKLPEGRRHAVDLGLVAQVQNAADQQRIGSLLQMIVRAEAFPLYLAHDGYELQQQGVNVRLVGAGTSAPVVEALADALQTIDFDTVQRDLHRALASAETDPEDAVTAACSVIESLCRSVLCELELPMPIQLDIKGLYKAVREPLGLAPGREDVSPQIAADVREILGGLNSTVQGIGALRTHAGDAHGRERGFKRIDARTARLAIHAAAGAAIFIIETWQKKFPAKLLHAR